MFEDCKSYVCVTLNIPSDTTGVAGYGYGRNIYRKQLKGAVKEDKLAIIVKFPVHVSIVSISFIQGLFEEMYRVWGYGKMCSRLIIKTDLPNLTSHIWKIIDVLFKFHDVKNFDKISDNKSISPFKNDPFSMVWQAYVELFNKPCEIYWEQHTDDSEHKNEYGYTSFPNDGSTPKVFLFAEHPVNICVETLGHELAHVAVGVEHEHDSVWENAFEAIKQKYDEIGTKWVEETVDSGQLK